MLRRAVALIAVGVELIIRPFDLFKIVFGRISRRRTAGRLRLGDAYPAFRCPYEFVAEVIPGCVADIHSLLPAGDQFVEGFDLLPSQRHAFGTRHDRVRGETVRRKADRVSRNIYVGEDLHFFAVIGKVDHVCVLIRGYVAFHIRKLDAHVNGRGDLDLVAVFVDDLDVKKAQERRASFFEVQRVLYFGDVVGVISGFLRAFSGQVLIVGALRQDLLHFKVRPLGHFRVCAAFDRDLIIAAVSRQYRRLEGLGPADAVDGEFVGLKGNFIYMKRVVNFLVRFLFSARCVLCDLVGRIAGVVPGARLDLEPVLSLQFGLDELGLVLFLLIKMDGVQACVRSHLHRFVILYSHRHFAGRLYFGSFI